MLTRSLDTPTLSLPSVRRAIAIYQCGPRHVNASAADRRDDLSRS